MDAKAREYLRQFPSFSAIQILSTKEEWERDWIPPSTFSTDCDPGDEDDSPLAENQKY